MRVRLLVGVSGSAINLVPGDEHEFTEAECLRLIAEGFAVAVGPVIERAVTDHPAETRVLGDHDGNGAPGGSLPGEQSTRAKGKRKGK